MINPWPEGGVDLSNTYAARAADYASDVDRRWFADHPGASSYVRAPIDGEFDGILGEGARLGIACVIVEPDCLVRVTSLGPGLRSRRIVSGDESTPGADQ